MKFLSIKEFFYKLNTIGFILLLAPMLVFIFLYYRPGYTAPLITDPAIVVIVLASLLFFIVADLTVVRWVWKSRMRKLKALMELSRKMDGYYELVLLKLGSYSGCSLMLGAGFYLTGNPGFTVIFLLVAVVILIEWPSASAFCRQFELDGAERDMVMKNLDLKNRKRDW